MRSSWPDAGAPSAPRARATRCMCSGELSSRYSAARASRSSVSTRIASVSRNAVSAWLATIDLELGEPQPQRAELQQLAQPREARRRRATRRRATAPRRPRPAAPPPSPSGSSRARTASASASRRQSTTCGCAAAAWAATRSSAGTRSTDGLPAAVSFLRRDSAATRFPPITSTRVPARASSSILNHDGGHDSGPAPGQGPGRLPDRGADRARRHGPRLPRRAPEAAPARRDQDHRSRAGRERGLPRALQPRGADGRRAAAPEHRDGLRRGRGGRPAVPRDAVHRGLRPLDRPAQPGPAAPLPRARRLPPGRRRARRRPRPRPDPPRHQARERADRGPHRVPDRLRADEADRGQPDAAHPGGRRRRHDPLRRAGADRGRPGRRAHRHLLARLPRLPLPVRRAAVRARHRRRGDLRAPVRGAAAAHRGPAGPARGPRRRDRQGAREGAGAALPDRAPT